MRSITAIAVFMVLQTSAFSGDNKDAPAKDATSEYKIVDASDLFIGSKKYIGRDIVLEHMRCYYADVDDYRCLASGGTVLAVFSKTVEPASAREWLEKNCDEIKRSMTSDKCRFNPRFSFATDDVEEDVISGFQQRKVIRLPAGMTMVPSSKIRAAR